MPDHSVLVNIVNAIPAAPALPFIQELQLRSGTTQLGVAKWLATPNDDGIVQVLHIQVDPIHQRKGYGTILMRAIYNEAATLFARLEIKPRRIWLTVQQKQQVTARAFLTRNGFHHVSTIANLHRKQDCLIYLRAFD